MQENTQNKKGFTQVENDLLENIFLFPLTKLDLAIIFITIRFTLGFHREQSAISLNKFARYTRSNSGNVSRSLQKLIRAKVIKVIEPDTGSIARVLKFNSDFSQWDHLLLKKDLLLSRGQQEVLSREQQEVLSRGQQEVLSGEQHYINKDLNKIKEINKSSSSSNNIIYLINEKEITTTTTTAILTEIEQKLADLYISCFGYNPNIYELNAVKKEIFDDSRFEASEILKIVQDSFHQAAARDESRRNTSYVIKVIRGKKQDLFLKKEKEKSERERLMANSMKEKEEYIPGSILGAFEKRMAERQEELKHIAK